MVNAITLYDFFFYKPKNINESLSVCTNWKKKEKKQIQKKEHESVITYTVIYFFFDVFVTSIIQYHKKNQVQNVAPAGD